MEKEVEDEGYSISYITPLQAYDLGDLVGMLRSAPSARTLNTIELHRLTSYILWLEQTGGGKGEVVVRNKKEKRRVE